MNKADRKTNQLIIVSIATLFLIALLAGCLGDDPLDSSKAPEYVDEPIVGLEIQHEEGSAQYGEERHLRDQVWRACSATGDTMRELCREHAMPATGELSAASETDPAFDIQGATFADNSTTWFVTIHLGALYEDWRHIQPWDRSSPEGRYYFNVGWNIEGKEDEIWGSLGLGVMNTYGSFYFDSSSYTHSADCNDWWTCGTRVPVEFEYGEPGEIRLMIPRAVLPVSDYGDRLNVTYVELRSFSSTNGVVDWRVSEGPINEEGRAIVGGHGLMIDRWSGNERFVFSTPKQPVDKEALTTPTFDVQSYAPYDLLGQHRKDIDLTEVRIDESKTNFSIEIMLEAVHEEPDDHIFWMALGMPNGRVHTITHSVADGEVETTAGYEDPNNDWRWIDVPVKIDQEPGEPGWIKFSWDRSDLGSPQKGERLGLLWIATGAPGVQEAGTSLGPLDLRFVEQTRAIGWMGEGPPPYWFRMDTATPVVEALGLLVEDTVGDTALPTMLPFEDVNEDQYDITFLQATGLDESTVQVRLGIQDLSRVDVPTGYEAVVYSVGIQNDHGDYMVFYYKDDDHQDFYCAADTLNFVQEPMDPNTAGWSRIGGLVSHGGKGPDGLSRPSTGTISFQIPKECLGTDEGETFPVHGLAAGTFLLENPLGISQLTQVHEVDTTYASPGELPFLLGVEPLEGDTPVAPAWYVAPLGLEGQDWNILGVVIAVLLAAGGAIAVWTKRRKLRNYLAQVDQAAAIKNLTARETALNELRTLLRADLVAGQISEGHYAVVIRHVDEAMKHVRVKSIEETFRELPFHIVSKLRSVLDDGVITVDEREMVTDLIDRAQIPANEKQKVLARLQRWQLVDEVAKA